VAWETERFQRRGPAGHLDMRGAMGKGGETAIGWAGHSSVEGGCAGDSAGCSGEDGRRRGKRSQPLGGPGGPL
jgi:hypothetical protein